MSPSMRNSVVALGLLFALGFAGSAPAQSPELSRGLTFEPPAPSDNEAVRVLVHGVWHDACPPVLVGSRLDGHRFEVDLDVPLTFAPCPQALTPFAFSLDLGPLDAGTYDVEVLLTDATASDPDPQLWQMGSFEVSDQPDTVYLHGGRFAVDVRWVDFAGTSGPAKLIPNRSDESAFLYFFQPDNAEMIVKVLDACTFNDHFWVFVAAATNVEYRITVLDTFTGVSWIYENPPGVRSPAIADTRALAVCP